VEVGGWRLSLLSGVSAISMFDPEGVEQPATHSSPESKRNPARTVPQDDVAAWVDRVGQNAPLGAMGSQDRGWARAAEALRRDDFAGADRAFAELATSPDAATRDASRLARAELWMAHGRGAEVRPVLEDLAHGGVTPLVRERAAECLARVVP
jgi:hypothetical protein